MLAHKLGMLLHRFRNRAEDDAGLHQFFFESGDNRNAVEDGVYRDL